MRTLLVVAVLWCSAALADDLKAIVKEHRLGNGMLWLVVERPQAPVFTGFIRVRVGGADEEPGYTGLAHLFEHMAFKGTPMLGTKDFEAEKKLLVQIAEVGDAIAALQRAGKGTAPEGVTLKQKLAELSKQHGELTDENALAQLYQLNGAVGLNATTDKDSTSYFVSLPKNRLELWLTLEAQRLAAPVLRDFYTERDVVQEERRMSIESSPGGSIYEELNQIAFVSSPYRWPTVGYTEDLQAMSLSKAQQFRNRYYPPGNAVGCLVGDVNFEALKPLLEKTFGAIPGAPLPPAPVFAEPVSHVQRRSTVFFDASSRLFLAFRKPSAPAHDDYVFDVLDILLGEGRTGRLHKRLVLKDRLVQGIGVFGAPGTRLPNLFVIGATPLKGVKNEDVEKAIWEELEKLKAEKVGEQELQKVRNRISADHARALDTNSGLASSLTSNQVVIGDWRYVANHPAVINAIQPDEIIEVAKKYFRPENSIIVDLARPAGGAK
jgi:predicted Zn-dependent peptidase